MAPLLILVSILVLQQSLPVRGYYMNHAPTPGTGRHKHHLPQQTQGRFSDLEKLLDRLESSSESRPHYPRVQEATPEPATVAPPLLRSAASHPHWKSYKPPTHHDSYEEDEDFENDDEDEEDFDDDEEDEETLDGQGNEQYHQSQSEDLSPWDIPQSEPRYRPQPSLSSISQSKWDTMGNRKSVDDLRNRVIGGYKSHHQNTAADMQKVVDHLLRVNRDGDCKVPKPRLVKVKDEYPHPSKTYLPRCTILHQCGDDSGCCKADTLTCVPRHSHRVELYFYVTTTVGINGKHEPPVVETLVFYNHTECMCEDQNSGLMPRDVETGHYFRRDASYGSGSTFRKPERNHHPEPEKPEKPEVRSCRCPSKYAVRRSRDGSCACDCFDKHRDCLRMKKGKDYFTQQDRMCIQTEECKSPSCEFGSYLRLAGRCPKKRERFEIWKQ